MKNLPSQKTLLNFLVLFFFSVALMGVFHKNASSRGMLQISAPELPEEDGSWCKKPNPPPPTTPPAPPTTPPVSSTASFVIYTSNPNYAGKVLTGPGIYATLNTVSGQPPLACTYGGNLPVLRLDKGAIVYAFIGSTPYTIIVPAVDCGAIDIR